MPRGLHRRSTVRRRIIVLLTVEPHSERCASAVGRPEDAQSISHDSIRRRIQDTRPPRADRGACRRARRRRCLPVSHPEAPFRRDPSRRALAGAAAGPDPRRQDHRRIRRAAPHPAGVRTGPRTDDPGVHRGRGRPLLRASRGRLGGPCPRDPAPRLHRGEGAGGQHHHHAGGQELLSRPGEDLHPQAQGDPARVEDRQRVHQGGDPGALRQQDLPRPSRLRGRRCGAGVLRTPHLGAHARPARDDRGPAEGAVHVQPHRQSRTGGGAPQLRAPAHARARLRREGRARRCARCAGDREDPRARRRGRGSLRRGDGAGAHGGGLRRRSLHRGIQGLHDHRRRAPARRQRGVAPGADGVRHPPRLPRAGAADRSGRGCGRGRSGGGTLSRGSALSGGSARRRSRSRRTAAGPRDLGGRGRGHRPRARGRTSRDPVRAHGVGTPLRQHGPPGQEAEIGRGGGAGR